MTEHTSRHYERELQELKEQILLLGGTVEEMIESAMRSLLGRDPDRARRVIESDPKVDAAELEIDHLCLNLLALRQPAASDLRFIATALKIVTDLERIGDLAVNIAGAADHLHRQVPRADRRPRHEHRPDGDLHVRGDRRPPPRRPGPGPPGSLSNDPRAGDPTIFGVLGAKPPTPFRSGWRVFYTQQHGDNTTWEIGRGNRFLGVLQLW